MMNKLKTIIIAISILFIFFAGSQCKEPQVIKFLSLEDQEVTVSVVQSDENDQLIIQLNNSETICINGSRGLTDVEVINRKFLKLIFSIRGGSGIARRRASLICVSNGQLHRALDVDCMEKSQFDRTYVPEVDSLNLYDEHSLYELTILMPPVNNLDWILAIEHDYVHSKFDPSQNKETWDTLKLYFDSTKTIFFSGTDSLSGNYIKVREYPENDIPITIPSDTYPVINLRSGCKYYFIDRKWYEMGRENYIFEYSSSCK